MLNIKIKEVYSAEVRAVQRQRRTSTKQNIWRTLVPDEQTSPQLIAHSTSTYRNPHSYDSPHTHTHPHCEGDGDGDGANQRSNDDVGAGESRLRWRA